MKPTTQVQIPILDLKAEIESLWEEVSLAVNDVLRSGHYIMGPHVKKFEEEAAAYLGVQHAVALNSGTDALILALETLGIGPGDEVITTAFTFFATAEAISKVGASPVFIDIDPVTFNLDTSQLESAISPHTKAIIPVHLFGQAAQMDEIGRVADEYGLFVIEDTAQSFGGEFRKKKLGTLGDVGCYSFFPSKNLGACGDGGMLVTDCQETADKARMLRVHGSRVKYFNEVVGCNSRLDEIQAAILRVKLPHIERMNDCRRMVAQRYDEQLGDLAGIGLPQEQENCRHVYHQYTIRSADGKRDLLMNKLKQEGIATMIYYPHPLHNLPLYEKMGVHLPETERAAQEVFSLPIWPNMPETTQAHVINVLRDSWR